MEISNLNLLTQQRKVYSRQREWPKFPGGGGIFEKFSARGYTKNTPIPVAWYTVQV